MKWFQVDSDTTDDRRIDAIIARLEQGGGSGMPSGVWLRQVVHGALLEIWCLTAQQTKARRPGWCERSEGHPFTVTTIAARCMQSRAFCQKLLDAAAAEGHIDPEHWKAGLVVFTAMERRGDEYTRKKLRRLEHAADTTASDEPSGQESGKKSGKVSGHKSGERLYSSSKKEKDPKKEHTQADAGLLSGQDADQVRAVVGLWNTITTRPSPRVDAAKLSAGRRTLILRVLKLHPDLNQWRQVLAYVERMPKRIGLLANGKPDPSYQGNHRGWTPEIDWLVRPGQFQRLFEKLTDATAPGPPDDPKPNRAAAKPGKYAELHHERTETSGQQSGGSAAGEPGGSDRAATAGEGDREPGSDG